MTLSGLIPDVPNTWIAGERNEFCQHKKQGQCMPGQNSGFPRKGVSGSIYKDVLLDFNQASYMCSVAAISGEVIAKVSRRLV